MVHKIAVKNILYIIYDVSHSRIRFYDGQKALLLGLFLIYFLLHWKNSNAGKKNPLTQNYGINIIV